MRRTAAETREHVLGVAYELFYRDGIRATGVDRVATEAEVAPTTLYRVFASKDDLVNAYVERASALHREWFTAAAGDAGRHPRDRILAVFDALIDRVQPPRCRGCPFQLALSEFPDADLPVHRLAREALEWVRDEFRALGRPARLSGFADPTIGDQLALIMEGVYASVQETGSDEPARQARVLVEHLLTAPVR